MKAYNLVLGRFFEASVCVMLYERRFPATAFLAHVIMLADPVLAFIKAFRLRDSAENLKRAAHSKFDEVVMCKAKTAVWDSVCYEFLSAAGLICQSHFEDLRSGRRLLLISRIFSLHLSG